MTGTKRIAIIGSGPGGALSAALLAEAGHEVTVYDEGHSHINVESEAFTRSEIERKYRNGGITAALGRPRLTYVEGRVVGGGSEINSGIYHRLPSPVLQNWRVTHRLQLDESELESYYRLNEGELKVQMTVADKDSRAACKLRYGAEALGWESLDAPRWFNESEGPLARQCMSRVYLPRASRAGAALKADHRVFLLRYLNRRWELSCRNAEADFTERVDHVVQAGGAIQSPWLLRRSGWKNGIGDRIYFHPTLKVVAEFPTEVNSEKVGVPTHQVKEFAPHITMGCSISRPRFLALGLLDHRDNLPYVVKNWRRHAIYYCMLSGESFGSVRAPLQDALVRYNLTRNDGERLFEGLGNLCRLLLTSGATKLYPSISGAPFITTENLDFFAQMPAGTAERMQLSTIHLMGGCAMGENENLCPTDSYGKLRGADGLWVSDASLLCSSIGVNPQGTIMALARRNCMRLIERLEKPR